jgi:hypothetical protein
MAVDIAIAFGVIGAFLSSFLLTVIPYFRHRAMVEEMADLIRQKSEAERTPEEKAILYEADSKESFLHKYRFRFLTGAASGVMVALGAVVALSSQVPEGASLWVAFAIGFGIAGTITGIMKEGISSDSGSTIVNKARLGTPTTTTTTTTTKPKTDQ